jgi:hypothetical protein
MDLKFYNLCKILNICLFVVIQLFYRFSQPNSDRIEIKSIYSWPAFQALSNDI